MLPLPGGAGLSPLTDGAKRLADFSASETGFGGIEPKRFVWALLDVLNGLRALHTVRIDGVPFVHGAISPQYVLLGELGCTKLVPVTSAHLMPNSTTEPSGYAAPELLAGAGADQRADVFSVGVLLWEALAGRRLFPDGSRAGVLAQFQPGRLGPLSALAHEDWAKPLCAVAERAVSLRPPDRFASALELSAAIVAVLDRQLNARSAERSPFSALGVEKTAPSIEAPPGVATSQSPGSGKRRSGWRTVTPPGTVIDLPTELEAAEPAPGSFEPYTADARPPTPQPGVRRRFHGRGLRNHSIWPWVAACLVACGGGYLASRGRGPVVVPQAAAVAAQAAAAPTATPIEATAHAASHETSQPPPPAVSANAAVPTPSQASSATRPTSPSKVPPGGANVSAPREQPSVERPRPQVEPSAPRQQPSAHPARRTPRAGSFFDGDYGI